MMMLMISRFARKIVRNCRISKPASPS